MREWRSYFEDGVKYLREKPAHAAVVGALVLAIFLTGSWQGSRKGAKTGAPGGRKILHYVDPMNPAHTS